uniref:Uncharacterized protein n=1 Tax=Acrobeloides nanus TaxID=290746 RepID=A0A914C8L7_9BILA
MFMKTSRKDSFLLFKLLSYHLNIAKLKSHSGFIRKCSSRTGISQLVKPSSASQPKMTTSASRFKIVPLETKYKRGRWECWDYYDDKKTIRDDIERPSKVSFAISNSVHGSNSTTPTSPKQPVTHSSIPIAPPNKPAASHTPEVQFAPRTQQPPTFVLEFSDDSDRENLPTFDDQPNLSTHKIPANRNRMLPNDETPAGKDFPIDESSLNLLSASPDAVLMSGRNTPSELLQQYGLERSLNATYNDHSILGLLPPGSASNDTRRGANMSWNSAIHSNSGNSVGGLPATAIDSKIEQAMDLVKTHLMYAVREEIEQLRTRIMDLETTVIQLEAENSILREHVPADILKNLNFNSSSTAVAQ